MAEFNCPKCGSSYFGRDTKTVDGQVVILPTVRCHGGSSDKPGWKCDWRGVWPEAKRRWFQFWK